MMRELIDRLRYRFELHAQEQRAERLGADGTQQPGVDRRWRLLLFLILFLNVTPWGALYRRGRNHDMKSIYRDQI